MKILFLDIDGVVNCATTSQRHDGFIGIDPYMALLVGRIVLQTDCKVVLSSSWRHHSGSREEVKKRVVSFIDITPTLSGIRGDEIRAWLDDWKIDWALDENFRYAILDDNSDFYPDQPVFKTSWATGITEEIAAQVIAHLNGEVVHNKLI